MEGTGNLDGRKSDEVNAGRPSLPKLLFNIPLIINAVASSSNTGPTHLIQHQAHKKVERNAEHV
jgi:hypothetical protein